MSGSKVKGKTLIVGMKTDAGSKELLNWVLVNVAKAGDSVIAVHALPTAADGRDLDWNPSYLISLMNAFDAVLAVYEGFCNLKQIDLKRKICRGSSIRKVLVHEASSVSAFKLIVGVSKNSNAIGSSPLSLATYCAKKLYRCCLVLAVSNGKIVFDNFVTDNMCTQEIIQKSDSMKLHKMDRQLTDSKEEDDTNISSSFDASESGESVIDEAISPDTCSKDHTSSESDRWSFLRGTLLNHKKNCSPEKPKSSVVQWAMWLPSWHSTSSVVHPYHKRAKSEVALKSSFDGGVYSIVPLNPASEVEVNGDEKELPKEILSLLDKYSSLCRLFTYKELMDATSNFSHGNIIGKGGNSMVYKGCLLDGKELAFKTLRCTEDLMGDFISEIEIMTNLCHRNIISLYGFCLENNHLVLVYDFLSRGSLEENLHGVKGDENALSWSDRYKIAVGVAEGLNYLHNDGSRHPVIHRDVKSSNILLSDDFEPQLSDFGLAQWASSSIKNSENTDCCDMAGTFGYLAPEYFMHGIVDEKIDIYAFGVVLLELLSGRKPISTGCPKGEESLVKWAKPILLAGQLDHVADPSLDDMYDSDEMERMRLTAFLCISESSHSRPTAALALKLLQGEDEVVEWARSELSASMASEDLDDEAELLHSNIQSHINLALLDMDENELSSGSIDLSHNFLTSNTSLEDYLKTRCSRSSSFDFF